MNLNLVVQEPPKDACLRAPGEAVVYDRVLGHKSSTVRFTVHDGLLQGPTRSYVCQDCGALVLWAIAHGAFHIEPKTIRIAS